MGIFCIVVEVHQKGLAALLSVSTKRLYMHLNMSCVMCNVSCVTCNVSRVTCHVSNVTCHFFFFFFGQSGEAYRWRVCYQRGLPRLVLFQIQF